MLVLGRRAERDTLNPGKFGVRDGSTAEVFDLALFGPRSCLLVAGGQVAWVYILTERRCWTDMRAAGEKVKLVRSRRTNALGCMIQ